MTAADIAEDMELFDAIETATLTTVNPDTGATTGSAPVRVLQRSTEITEQKFGAHAIARKITTRFHIKASSSARPKERDRITDSDGIVYVIGKVSVMALDTRFACEVTQSPDTPPT